MEGYLIPTVDLKNHEDPMFSEFTYGGGGIHAKAMASLEQGDIIFFHKRIGARKYITGYYVIQCIMDTKEAVSDSLIKDKYKNPHLNAKYTEKIDWQDFIIFGDPLRSKKLKKPLPFTKELANDVLHLNIKFNRGRTDTAEIGSATRSWRKLDENQIASLRRRIKDYGEAIEDPEILRSTQEVIQLLERDIESLLQKNKKLIGHDLIEKGRQPVVDVGRFDLFYEDKDGNPIVVEIKLDALGHEAKKQIRRYMDHLKKEYPNKKVRGILVGSRVLPQFEEEFSRSKDISIFTYGWKLGLQKFGEL